MCEVTNIQDAVKVVCVPVKDENPVSIVIRRSNVLRDALKEFRKAKFHPDTSLTVNNCHTLHFDIITLWLGYLCRRRCHR